MHGFAQKHKTRIYDSRVKRAQKGHEADLDKDSPFEPYGPILLVVSTT